VWKHSCGLKAPTGGGEAPEISFSGGTSLSQSGSDGGKEGLKEVV